MGWFARCAGCPPPPATRSTTAAATRVTVVLRRCPGTRPAASVRPCRRASGAFADALAAAMVADVDARAAGGADRHARRVERLPGGIELRDPSRLRDRGRPDTRRAGVRQRRA